MPTELRSVDAVGAYLSEHRDLDDTVIQRVDLRPLADVIVGHSAKRSVLLGCQLTSVLQAHLLASRATIFPTVPSVPFEPYRCTLYDPETLFDGYEIGAPETLANAYDTMVYAYYDAHRKSRTRIPIDEAMAQRLHDHAIDDALFDFLTDGPVKRSVVAFMGGHGMDRGDDAYRTVAEIARQLAGNPSIVVASGGGPGAMEAANLGATFAGLDNDALTSAIDLLAEAPSYTSKRWLDQALRVKRAFPTATTESLGIPTWFYGHEPPNVFATHIAKYFSNSIREDRLLEIATRGVIFAPGSAGTIQEIFMDACQNHYQVFGGASPMIFLDRTYWTETKPVYPVLRALAEDRDYGALIAIGDTVEEILHEVSRLKPTSKG
jgi:predicted Rossmann-fold nucleotide-binding protein